MYNHINKFSVKRNANNATKLNVQTEILIEQSQLRLMKLGQRNLFSAESHLCKRYHIQQR